MSNPVLLVPGIKFMQGLNFGKKFLVLVILFVIPIIWLVELYVADNIKIIQFSEKERLGLQYIEAIYPVMRGSAKIRGLTNAYLNGNSSVKDKLDEAVAYNNNAFDTLTKVESKIINEISIQTSIKALRSRFTSIQKVALSQSASKTFSAYTHYISLLHNHIIHVADVSNLILDSDLNTHYLMDSVVVSLPAMLDKIGQTRGLGTGVAVKKSFTPEAFTNLTGLVEKITLFGKKVEIGINKVLQESIDAKNKLGRLDSDFTQKWKAYVHFTKSRMLDPDEIQVDSNQYFNEGTETLKTGYQLSAVMFPLLDSLLIKRIDEKKLAMYKIGGVMIVAFILIAYLFLSFSNSVLKSINEINSTVIELSKGNFKTAVTVNSKDEIGSIADNLNAMIERISALVSLVINSANQVASAATQTSTTATQSREDINRQNSEIEQVATAINEMSATVSEVAVNTTSAAELTQVADLEADNGRKVVSQSVESINRLAGEMESSSQIIHDLETQSEGIGKVIDVIRGIAEQTNLLALNAAIEAARAGEQGRGFAVVADEVRTLASRTQVSTQEINDMVDKLQVGARSAVEAMAQGTSQTVHSVEQSVQAGAALDKISTAVSTIFEMNAQIASAAEEQSCVSEEINRNIVNIRDIAEATVKGANQTAQSSESMSEVANELISLVNEFKV